jgi:hypothetical protein
MRCVNCGRAKTVHMGDRLVCHGSAGEAAKVFETLDLPTGKTCGDCVHFARCAGIFGRQHVETFCDFFPIRFRERVPA